MADACDSDAGGTVAVGTSTTPCLVRADVPPNPAPEGPGHAVHVCHCVHTHNSRIAATVVLILPFSQVAIHSVEPGLLPPGRRLQPPQRPPLV